MGHPSLNVRIGRAQLFAVTLATALSTFAIACAPAAQPTQQAKPAQPTQQASAPAQPTQQSKPQATAAPAATAAAPAKPVTHPTIRLVAGSRTSWTGHLGVVVAMQQGFFKDAGLNSVEFTKAGSDGTALSAVFAGSQDFAIHMATQSIAKAVAQGEQIFIIGSTSHKLPHIIFGSKGMSKVADLKGKKIATDTGTGIVDAYVEMGLARNGMQLSDVTLVRTGNSAERYRALANGVVDASMIGPSEMPRAIEAGYPQLMDLGELYDDYLQRTYAVNGKFMQANPETVNAFMLAMVRAHDFLFKPENVDRIWQIVDGEGYGAEQKYFKGSLDAQLHLMPRNALPTAEGLQIVLNESGDEVKGVTADKLLRLDPVRKAIEKTGVKAS